VILGIESSGKTGGVCLLTEHGVRATVMTTSATLYSQRLLPYIDWVLQRVNAKVSDLKGIAVSLGPGSFTGLRLGLSSAKGLAVAHGLPVVGVRTMEALALRVAMAGLPPRICTVIDARNERLCAALFQVEAAPVADATAFGVIPQLTYLRSPEVCSLESVCEWIEEPTVFAGDAALNYRTQWEQRLGKRFVLPPLNRILPSAEEVAVLGAVRIVRGESDSLAELEPFYLRVSYMESTRPKRS